MTHEHIGPADMACDGCIREANYVPGWPPPWLWLLLLIAFALVVSALLANCQQHPS